MTKIWDVPSHEHGGFFAMAQEYLGVARIAVDARAYDAAVSNCADSALNAVDAMTVLRAGKRSARYPVGVSDLARSVLAGGDRAGLARQYRSLLALKIPAEYEATMMTARQASNALKWAVRIVDAARAEIEGKRGERRPARPRRRPGPAKGPGTGAAPSPARRGRRRG